MSRYMCRKTKRFSVKFRHNLEVFVLQGLQKKVRAHFLDFCVQKRSCLPWSWDAFLTFSSCMLYINVLGAFSRFMRQKRICLPWNSDAFWKFSACKFCRKGSGRNSTICVSKNEAVCCEVQTHFGSFRLSSFIKIALGAFSRFASKNETVCRWAQTHFGSSLPARFAEKGPGAIPRFMCPKMKLFAVKFRLILEVLAFQAL